jgi:hypothetical protein
MTGADATVVHAYGLVRPGVDVRPEGGIDAAGLLIVGAGDVAAVASVLSADRYGFGCWRARGEDPQWLRQVAGEHHAVLQSVAESHDVLPFRLPGMHASLDTLRTVLAEHAAELGAALARVRGHLEWGAKVYWASSGHNDGLESEPASGRDYLMRQVAEKAAAEQASDRRIALVLDAHQRMAEASTRATTNPPQHAAVSGRSEPMLLNAAYLVPRPTFDRFLGLVEELALQMEREGLALEVTGPWPPYNFADLSDCMTGKECQ